jgi:hypothetical protein
MVATFPPVETDPAFAAGGATDAEVEAVRAVLAAADASEIADRLAADALKQDAATAATDAELAAVYPWRIDIVPFTNTIFVQGTRAFTGPGNNTGGGTVYNNTGALNDEYGWDVVLGAGTWSFEGQFQRQNSGAIASLRLDGVEITTFDMYTASPTPNAIFGVAGIIVPTSGKKRLTLKATSRNALNTTGYYMITQALSLRRTA